ncbi:MAG: twin-arginine translocase subunit TatC [Acidimicrobiales bacterium]
MAAPARLARLRARREHPRPSPDAMTLGEHLGELRRRLIICIVAVAAGAVVTYVLYDQILAVLQSPYCQAVTHTGRRCQFYVTQPLQGFALRLNVSAYGGLLIALPITLYQLWQFVTPGLKANEKKYALPFTFATAGLFALGSYVAYLTFPHAMRFLLDVSGPSKTIVAIMSPNSYVQLILLLMVAFGVTFEFPVVLVALEIAGVLTPAKLSKWRRWAIIGMVLFAAVVTPSSDPFSMLALAIPLLLFYEASIVVGKLLGK